MLGFKRRTAAARETVDATARVADHHARGRAVLAAAAGGARHPEPAEGLPEADGLPELTPEQLTPGLLRAAILRDGCALVRGLVPRDAALALAARIDTAFTDREKAIERGDGSSLGVYDPRIELKDGLEVRGWVRQGGGLLGPDAPAVFLEFLETLRAARVDRLVEGYLGEPPLLSVEKTTLRKATPDVKGAWHQDGKFMGEVRALNLWLSLSRCGDEAPGLDVVPRRLPELVSAGGDGTFLHYQVTDQDAERVAAPKAVVRPIFEPGDALLFDDLFLHQTASEPSMPKPRYAVESWFFGASAFPREYVPIAP